MMNRLAETRAVVFPVEPFGVEAEDCTQSVACTQTVAFQHSQYRQHFQYRWCVRIHRFGRRRAGMSAGLASVPALHDWVVNAEPEDGGNLFHPVVVRHDRQSVDLYTHSGREMNGVEGFDVRNDGFGLNEN